MKEIMQYAIGILLFINAFGVGWVIKILLSASSGQKNVIDGMGIQIKSMKTVVDGMQALLDEEKKSVETKVENVKMEGKREVDKLRGEIEKMKGQKEVYGWEKHTIEQINNFTNMTEIAVELMEKYTKHGINYEKYKDRIGDITRKVSGEIQEMKKLIPD